MKHRQLVERYFTAEERGDVAAVVALCSEDVIVRNAAQPPQHGRQGVRDYVTSFRDRTSRRNFEIMEVVEENNIVYAWWHARLTFREGVSFGPVTTRRHFDLDVQGVCRFRLDENDEVQELDVFHETTSAFQLAQEAAA
jgi:ketosteroid isomerase-like protein